MNNLDEARRLADEWVDDPRVIAVPMGILARAFKEVDAENARLRRHLERAQGSEADLAKMLLRAEAAEAQLRAPVASEVHHDFDLERISLALVQAVDEEYARNEMLRMAFAHDKDFRLKTIAAVNKRMLEGWIELIIEPLIAKFHRHIKSMQRIVERYESAATRAYSAPAASDTPETDAAEFEYDGSPKWKVFSDFARSLERRLREAEKAQLASRGAAGKTGPSNATGSL